MITNAKRFARSKVALSVLLMTAGSLAMFFVALLTLFQARRLYAERMAAPLGRCMLRLWGIRVRVHGKPANFPVQCVFISNHTSTIDIFVVIAMALPNTRFFMSGFLRKLPSLGLIGYLVGTIWTVPQEFPERRVQIFKRATERLRSTGESVYLSPEGERVTTGKVGYFNKGSFHLAMSLGAPIVPFYIATPPEVNPGVGIYAGPGLVDVYFKPIIETDNWILDNLVANKEHIRDQFVEWNDAHC